MNKEKSKIRIAVVGVGRIGKRHCKHIQNMAKLVGVADIVENRAKEVGEHYNCPWYSSLEEMLASLGNIDVIAVCTPNSLHAEHTYKALAAKCHVLCEKPMALTVIDCEKMITAAEYNNRRLFIVKQNRFNPPIVSVKNFIDKGKLGKIFSVQLNCFWNRHQEYYLSSNWKGSLELDGGILFTQFSHFIDLLYWFIGDIDDVQAYSANYNHKNTIEFEDTLVSILHFSNGVIGTVNCTINAYEGNYEGSLIIFGEKGTVKIGGQYLNILEYQKVQNKEIKLIDKCRPPNRYGEYEGSMSNHDLVYKNLIDVLENGAQIATSGLEGMKTVQIVRKIYDSLRNNEQS